MTTAMAMGWHVPTAQASATARPRRPARRAPSAARRRRARAQAHVRAPPAAQSVRPAARPRDAVNARAEERPARENDLARRRRRESPCHSQTRPNQVPPPLDSARAVYRVLYLVPRYRDLVESNSIPTASVSRVRGLLSASNFEPGIIAEVTFRHVVVGLWYVLLGANFGACALIADRRQRHSANSRRVLGVPATPSGGGEEGLGRGRRRRRPWRARGAPRRRRRRSCSTTAAECARAGRAARRGAAARAAVRARVQARAPSHPKPKRAPRPRASRRARRMRAGRWAMRVPCARVSEERDCVVGGRGEEAEPGAATPGLARAAAPRHCRRKSATRYSS